MVLSTTKAGGPYKITVECDTTIVLKNILLGDVWICSGQSNMDMPLKGFEGQGVEGSQQEIVMAGQFRNIRFFKVERKKSSVPLKELSLGEQWQTSNSSNTSGFSAVAWFFGKMIHQATGVPIGLIQVSWGGTAAELWVSKEGIAHLPKIDTAKVVAVSGDKGKLKSSMLYNAMINPLTRLKIKGVIWYQGESNVKNYALYYKLFPELITDWRTKWNRELPFYFVQIAPFMYSAPDSTESAFLREAQLKTMMTVPNTGMAVTLDIGYIDHIHPEKKKEVGERLAYWALAHDYSVKGLDYTAPVYKSMEIKNDTMIIVHLKNDGSWITRVRSDELEGCFEIAGKDRHFHPAKARVQEWNDYVEVWSKEVPSPVAVRYCFKNWCTGKLKAANGLPVSSFRTDDW